MKQKGLWVVVLALFLVSLGAFAAGPSVSKKKGENLLYDCGFRWVRSLDFNELALEMIGDYQRERLFRFQHLALAAVHAPVAGWP